MQTLHEFVTDGPSLLDGAGALVERLDGTLVPGLGDFQPAQAGRPIRYVGNIFTLECVRPDGSIAWREEFPNMVTLAGLDHTLNVVLVNQTQVSTWYLGIVDNAGFTAFANADSMTSHPGWSESAVYSGTTRPAWTPGTSSGQAVTNSATVNYSITTAATLRGLFLVSTNTRGGTDGVLFSTAAFSAGNQPVNPGDTLKGTYTVSASSSS